MFLFRRPHPGFAQICRVRLDNYLLLKEIAFSTPNPLRGCSSDLAQ